MKKNRLISVFLILFLSIIFIKPLFQISSSVNAEPKTKEVVVITLGYYEIWVHSDGTTWQYGVSPNSHVNYKAQIKYPYSDIDKVVGLKSVTFFTGGGTINVNETTFSDKELWNKYRSWENWTSWLDGYERASVQFASYPNVSYIGNGKGNITIATTLTAKYKPEERTKEWQNENVQGLRYYIPRVEIWLVEDDSNIDINCSIDDLPTSAKNNSDVEGTFNFNISSEQELSTYEIYDVKGAVIQGPVTKNISGNTYSGSIPISVNMGNSDKVVEISIKAYDKYDNEASDKDTKTIQVYTPIQNTNMNPNVSGVIRADNRGAETFEVTKGIPTSEDLYINVMAKQYLHSYEYSNITGNKSYSVNVGKTYNLVWEEDHGHTVSGTSYCSGCKEDEDGEKYCDGHYYSYWSPNWVTMTDSVPVTNNYTVTRSFSYYIIDKFEVYGLKEANVSNYSLPNESMTLQPNNYQPPNIEVEHSKSETDHIIEPANKTVNINLPSSTLNGGRGGRPSVPSENWQTNAEGAVGQIRVKNDKLIFNNKTIMNNTWSIKETTAPLDIPISNMINQNTLYKKDITISNTKANGIYNSSGSTTYERLEPSINPQEEKIKSININGINSVVVHTPVVCYPTVTNKISKTQTINPNTNLVQLQIGDTIEVNYPTTGAHRNIKGYGTRDYNKYTQKRQILFTFDTYLGRSREGGVYIPKSTWIDYPNNNEATFYIPTWVEENTYKIAFRTIPINILDINTTKYQFYANGLIENYKAINEVDVEISGKIYDFRITDVTDFYWEEFFRVSRGSIDHSGKYLYAGTKDKNGNTDNSHKYTLPAMENKMDIPTVKENGVKLGYGIRFDFKTNGDYYKENDLIIVTPRFYHLDKEGKNREEVDIYYEAKGSLIKVGSDQDILRQTVILNDPYRNIPNKELENTAKAYEVQNRGQGKDYNYYIERLTRQEKHNIKVGDKLLITEKLRTLIGDTTNIPPNIEETKVIQSVQKWHGEYFLPNKGHIVPKDMKIWELGALDTSKYPFIHGGYIVVNFDIKTYKNCNPNIPLEQNIPTGTYNNITYNNMWQTEGFNRNQQGYELDYGDIVVYYKDKSASMDFH